MYKTTGGITDEGYTGNDLEESDPGLIETVTLTRPKRQKKMEEVPYSIRCSGLDSNQTCLKKQVYCVTATPPCYLSSTLAESHQHGAEEAATGFWRRWGWSKRR